MFNSVFKYNNRKYDLKVEVINGCTQDQTVMIPENVLLFQYTNEMNDLNLHGFLEYKDTDSRIDPLLETEFSYCKVLFSELEQSSDGSIELDEFSEEHSLELNFFIDNYEILENSEGQIVYRLHLISSNWFNCSKIVNYTNYGGEQKYIFDIIKEILQSTDNDTDQDSFDEIDKKIKISYITGNDETVYSTVKWLMNRMYYLKDTEESVKGIFYNEKMDKICAYDINKVCEYQGCSMVEVNILKCDPVIQTEEPVNIAFQIRKSKSDVIKSTFPMKVYNYNMLSNSFYDYQFDCQKIVNYYNAESDAPKLSTFSESEKFQQTQLQWNNDIDIYSQHFDNLVKTNGLIINMIGQCGIVPGYRIGVYIPVNSDTIGIEDKKEYKKQMEKYQTITGTWYVSKITHFINPQKSVFRQSISLFRNGK